MIDGLKPYPSYKDSGVPWLGKVPEHWESLPLCAIARPRNVTNVVHRELLSVYLGRGVIPFSAVDEKRTNPTSEDLSKYQAVEPGDFVLNNQQAWRGSVGVSRYAGIVSPAYLVLALDNRLHREFADRLLSDRGMIDQYLVCSKGVGSIQRNLYWPHLRRALTLVPPVEEQAAIVRYLDHVDRRIRRYIRAKQKLIKLLEEQKRAIIHRAVTRSLDPNVRVKPSGVEWLGDVPAHCEVKRLKWVTRLQRGYDLPADQRVRGPYPVVSSGGIIDTHAYYKCTAPGVVMGRYGSTDAVFYIDQEFWPHNTSLFVTHFNGNIPKWCYYLLRSITKAEHSGKSAVPGLDRKDLFEIVVAVPPVDEQSEIVRSIEERTEKLNQAVETATSEISLLREYRTRLIADVVTGKLDVREAAAKLPDEAEEPEPSEEDDALSEAEEYSNEDLDAGSEVTKEVGM